MKKANLVVLGLASGAASATLGAQEFVLPTDEPGLLSLRGDSVEDMLKNEYMDFLSANGKSYSTLTEWETRFTTYVANWKKV